MPLWFVVSGYFYKPQSLRESIVSNFKRLIIPYFFCASICIIIMLAIGIKGRSFMNVVFPYIYVNSDYHPSLYMGNIPKMFGLWFYIENTYMDWPFIYVFLLCSLYRFYLFSRLFLSGYSLEHPFHI